MSDSSQTGAMCSCHVAGYALASMPADIQEAVVQLMVYIYQIGNLNQGLNSWSLGDYSESIRTIAEGMELPANVKMLCAAHRSITINMGVNY